MTRGEVRWYTFKKPDKKRPILILTRNSILDYMNEVTIAPITTTIRNIPSELFLSKEDGMPKDCVVNFDHIQTVAKSKIGPMITRVSPGKMKQVGEAIRFALEL